MEHSATNTTIETSAKATHEANPPYAGITNTAARDLRVADYGRDEGFNRALHRGVNILDPAEPEKDAAMSDHGVVTVNLAAANCISTSESSAQDASTSMSSAQNKSLVMV